ncbi:MAG: tRNA (guanosine(37)-N1)-methyltransferase TrmD [Rickettsiales bacterium]|nr:tRNA (guanosine(37)-N1)-methyltransferase TrmD [Rickettsiales bacterium]OUV54581.1 MAG: tRNA (guanosine(37)-N1)-methyltransferase TrmD [Rickettsiales bacterium TMED127]|tara:strand:+ start:794 stop:1498 length:705 start_codon:yes stop_codon:yes gene_type:complete
MKFKILTLFPEIFPGPLGKSIIGKALNEKKFSLETFNIRDFSTLKNKRVDEKPFGGGAGMVLRSDIMQRCLDYSLNDSKYKKRKIINFSPRGEKLDQNILKKFLEYDEIVLICGRYEGIDQRFLDFNIIEEVSVGDYVLSCGDIAAFILIDSCVRLIPEVLGNKDSLFNESFHSNLLEYPHYTKPRNWNKLEVPSILLSGNHNKIEEWRKAKAKEITKKARPDLWKLYKKKKEF